MKYPFIIFYREDKDSALDQFFFENNALLNCTVHITNKISKMNRIYSANYHLLITLHNEIAHEIDVDIKEISDNKKYIKLTKSDFSDVKIFNDLVNNRFILNCSLDRSYLRPVFSLFTSSFNSYEKIIRAYNSIKKQTLENWEWVIIDDSPDDKHFLFLKKNLSHDCRIRMYKRSENSGSIGNVKNEAVSLCRGNYVLEMDHDDEILPTVLEDATNVFSKNEEIGFIYMDFINIYENGDNFKYGDHICKGYGSYYCQKYNGKWAYVYNTPNINNITLSHLVCCPNHPRIWRRDLLLKLGNYCENLPICDDYEILLRTAINCKMAKIPKLGYVQYMNNSNNNFSLIRNGEINRIGPQYISPIYYKEYNIAEKMAELGAYEDPFANDTRNNVQIWTRDKTYVHKYCNLLVNMDFKRQICIVGLDSLILNLEYIKVLYNDDETDFILLDNKCPIEYLWKQLDSYGFDRMKCYSFIDVDSDLLVRYFKTTYLTTKEYEIVKTGYINRPKYNTQFTNRSHAINSVTHPDAKYLEIGVEYGQTFLQTHFKTENKMGVDPDPKFDVLNKEFQFSKSTSDDFFKDNTLNETKYDAIFIDGMHQSEYFLRDFSNSVKVLEKDGSIFIDDILPLTYNEQLKIPRKHYYENGILKYGEEWTGDIWKVVYHILKNYLNNLEEYKYFYNPCYRGVLHLKLKSAFEIPDSELETINNYDYFTDFPLYLGLLNL
uniref:Glycosyltransferase 2-like domain-containing protein n=1 Tax=viral metagenome TaxID=1070528 RepID=A0A6C0I9U8_9ZZZZ